MKDSKELQKLKRKYEKLCEKIEQLNEDAFILEKEITFQQNKEN